ncbi:epoxide hydrolase family protein [Streptomyces sp. NPDC058701]|uniref:epoxide hydrolase family protein n=1 Tax=Streptomyces sp. NPDC058701 TaxID=3346608 RepID=UPI0036698E21
MRPEPFHLQMSDVSRADLRDRLARTRWPDEPAGEAWKSGTSLAYAKELVRYWESDFDWKAQEERINGFRQYRVEIDGIALHYIHEPGRCENPMPLLLSHGWPGSIVEFLDVIPRLTEHFTVVVPSLPGYPLSFRPGQRRFGVAEIADTFAKLMTDVLGYTKFGAQGGDWGAFITSRLGAQRPELLTGIHLNYLAVLRNTSFASPTEEERQWLVQLEGWVKEGSAYATIQGTRPQTLAYGLTDSPAGLASWIVEKFHAWTDHKGVVESAVSRDDMLANISLYWFTGAIGSSFWPYYARSQGPWPIPSTVDVPTAYTAFPKEILRPPRSVAEKTYTNIQRWTDMDRGGHFAALEQPELLADDITAFFKGL